MKPFFIIFALVFYIELDRNDSWVTKVFGKRSFLKNFFVGLNAIPTDSYTYYVLGINGKTSLIIYSHNLKRLIR